MAKICFIIEAIYGDRAGSPHPQNESYTVTWQGVRLEGPVKKWDHHCSLPYTPTLYPYPYTCRLSFSSVELTAFSGLPSFAYVNALVWYFYIYLPTTTTLLLQGTFTVDGFPVFPAPITSQCCGSCSEGFSAPVWSFPPSLLLLFFLLSCTSQFGARGRGWDRRFGFLNVSGWRREIVFGPRVPDFPGHHILRYTHFPSLFPFKSSSPAGRGGEGLGLLGLQGMQSLGPSGSD